MDLEVGTVRRISPNEILVNYKGANMAVSFDPQIDEETQDKIIEEILGLALELEKEKNDRENLMKAFYFTFTQLAEMAGIVPSIQTGENQDGNQTPIE